MAFIVEFSGNGVCGRKVYQGAIGGLFDLLVNMNGAGYTCKWRRA
jgi:hypothetical protein